MARVPGEPRDRPSPSHTKVGPDGQHLWARLPLVPPSESPALAALRRGEIEHADLAVLQGIALSLEWVAGRCWVSVPELAEIAVMPVCQVEAAAARLLQAQVVAIGQDRDIPSLWFWKLNPMHAAHGGPGRGEQACWAGWFEAVANGWQRPPRPGELGGTRPRQKLELARARAAREQVRAAMEAALTEPVPDVNTTPRRRRTPRSAAAA